MEGSPNRHQADLVALQMAAQVLGQFVGRGPIALHTTSQAVLQVLNKPTFNSSLALSTAIAIDKLSEDCPIPILLSWSKAGAKQAGADMATTLANQALAMDVPEGAMVVPASRATLRQHFSSVLEAQWNARWQNAPTARLSRTFWPMVDKAKSRQLLQGGRDEYTVFVRIFTGHNNLNKHRYRPGKVTTDECRLCKEGEESSEHILCECPDLNSLRERTVGQPTVTEPKWLSQVPLSGIWQLISLSRRRLQEEGLEQI
jgi:hypothetical protein